MLDIQYRKIIGSFRGVDCKSEWYDLHSNMEKDSADYWIEFYKGSENNKEFRCIKYIESRKRNFESIRD